MATLKVTYGQITDKGLKRDYNEDNLLAMPKRGVYIVADGVGGRQGGQVASRTVVDVFSKVFMQEQQDDLRDLVASTIDLCNRKIFEDAAGNPELSGMATTIALLAVEGERAIVAHAGDSRVYRYDDQGLICLTEDHSEVNDALRAGLISEEQAATYPRRNVINRALGAEPEVEPDIIEIDINDRTSFLLCSDGITRHISDEEIESLIESGRRPQTLCEMMKDICYNGGAEDNLTAIIVDFGERNYVEDQTKPAMQTARTMTAPATGAVSSRQTGQLSQTGQAGHPSHSGQNRKIEVSLSGAQSDESSPQWGGGYQNKERGAAVSRAGYKPAGPAGEDTRSAQASVAPARNPQSQGFPKGSQTGVAQGAAPKTNQDGDLSNAMKWAFVGGALLAGILIGSMFGKPIADRIERLLGHTDIYQISGIDEPPGDAEVSAAFARFLEGHPDEARQRLDQVLAGNPGNAEAYFYLGRIDYAQDKYEDSINHLNQALRLNPNLPNIRAHLAMAYLSVGQQRNARDMLQQMVAPSSPLPSPTAAASVTPVNSKPANGK